MEVSPEKLRAVVKYWGSIKGYPEKSHLTKFTEELQLNYKQWASMCSGKQVAGSKIVDIVMDVFPSIDLNWLLKTEVPVNDDMFNLEKKEVMVLNEPREPLKKEITNEQIFTKLEELQFEIKTGFSKK